MARSLPRSLLLAGTTGSLLVAIGGLGVGALPAADDGRGWFGVEALAGSPAARALSTALVVVGVLLLAGAWWRSRRVLDDVGPGALVRATGLWSLPLLVAPPMFSRDVYAYAGQALLVVRGLDPYGAGPEAVGGEIAANVDDVWLDTPSPYGPAFLAPAALLVRLAGEDVVASALLLRLPAVLGLALTAWALTRLARAHGVPAARALWLGLANPLGLLHLVGGAHNDALMVGLLLAGLAVRRLVAAGALVALAGLVKAPALAALPFLVLAVPGLRTRLRAGALLGTGAAMTAAVVTLVTGLGFGWVAALDAGRARLSLFSPTTGVGVALGRAAETLGLVDDAADVREAVLLIGVLTALLAGAALLTATRRLGPVRAVGVTLLVVVALSPTVLPWYVLWGVVPLAAVVRARTAVALGALCLVLCLTVWPGGRSVVRPPLYGVPLLAAAAVAAVVWRRSDHPAGEQRAGDPAPTANS